MTDNAAVIKIIANHIKENKKINDKYLELGANHVRLVNKFTDLKLSFARLKTENKSLKSLLETAEEMLTQLRGERKEFVEDLNINFLVHASTNLGTTRDRAKLLMMKWEGEQ